MKKLEKNDEKALKDNKENINKRDEQNNVNNILGNKKNRNKLFIFNSKFILRRSITYLVVIEALLISLCIKDTDYIIPSIIISLILVVFENFAFRRKEKLKAQEFLEYTSDFNIVTQNTIVDSPFPLIIAESDANILWKSKSFSKLFNDKRVLNRIENLIHTIKFEIDNSEEKINILRKISFEDKMYMVHGLYSRAKRKNYKKQQEYIITLFFIDITNEEEIKNKYEEEKVAIGIINIDNYDEIISRISAAEKPRILSEIEKNVYEWVTGNKGIFIKTSEDEYVVLFEKKEIDNIRTEKFSILEKTKNIQSDINILCTLSIAICADGDTLSKRYVECTKLMDVILGRGGDQAGLKINGEYKFFGGKTKEVEKLNKVKARVVSKQISDKAKISSNVIVMGHSNIDIDAIGSCIGMVKFLSAYNKNVFIASNADSAGLGEYREELRKDEFYKEILLTKQEARQKVNKDTLLVIVDVHREAFTEYPELVEEVKNIVVIDHHRKLVDFIDKAIIKYHEVYASSASELVTELIEYSEEKIDLTSFEAESLYGGMLVDTKNFTFKTGVRTFEAAAFLRKFGIDIVKVKKWFEANLESYMDIYEIIKHSEIYRNKIAIAKNSEESIDANLKCAKAADQMLNISNIDASITYGYDGKQIQVCLRSIGNVNMQVIAEKLGGGGHLTLAGAQIKTDNLKEAEEKIKKAVDEYLEEIGE